MSYEPSLSIRSICCCAAHRTRTTVKYGPRLRKLVDDDGWVDPGWLRSALGATCLMLNPVFQSLTAGYDTITDHTTVDCRLGTNDDLRLLWMCHKVGISRALLDMLQSR